jgi:hypothetical protein
MTSLGFRSRKGLVSIAAVLAAALAVAAAVWFVVLRDVAEPTTVGDAVSNFRETTEGGAEAPLPVGVYVYATGGFEKTDALTGVTHRYPRRSTVTVTSDPCGVQMRWDVLKGRSTVWTYCIGSSGWTLASQDESHTFFGRTERTMYMCGDMSFWPKVGAGPGRSPFRCVTPTAQENGQCGLVGRDRVSVGARKVQTVHLRKTSSFTGEIRGTSTYDFWLDRESGVPLRIVMVSTTTNDSAVGDVNYEEHVRLELESLAPRR